MINPENFKSEIFFIQSNQFETQCLLVFNYQYEQNTIYQQYCEHIGKHPGNVNRITDIPFLPIEFFKSRKVVTGSWVEEKIFKSSGTTQQTRSLHFVKDLEFYHNIARHTFEQFYGKLADYEILALLPSYQEQGDSSLISMVDHFMSLSRPESQYFLGNHTELINQLSVDSSAKKLVMGVSFALLDLLDNSTSIPGKPIVMETGGMKGRRREMIREELHDQLKSGFEVPNIHSEYGMTELTSQAYSVDGIFQLPEWCKILIRDINDPLSYLDNEKTGGINIIDLGNIHSCAFIETKDLGKTHKNGTFEVLGRFDNSDIRGCNLLVS